MSEPNERYDVIAIRARQNAYTHHFAPHIPPEYDIVYYPTTQTNAFTNLIHEGLGIFVYNYHGNIMMTPHESYTNQQFPFLFSGGCATSHSNRFQYNRQRHGFVSYIASYRTAWDGTSGALFLEMLFARGYAEPCYGKAFSLYKRVQAERYFINGIGGTSQWEFKNRGYYG